MKCISGTPDIAIDQSLFASHNLLAAPAPFEYENRLNGTGLNGLSEYSAIVIPTNSSPLIATAINVPGFSTCSRAHFSTHSGSGKSSRLNALRNSSCIGGHSKASGFPTRTTLTLCSAMPIHPIP